MLEQMEQLNGCNLYAYCLNNPIMHTDPEGTFLFLPFLIGFIVGAVVSSAVSVVSQGIENGWDNINVGQVILDGVIGGIGGALAGTGLGLGWQVGINAALGGINSIGNDLIAGNNIIYLMRLFLLAWAL